MQILLNSEFKKESRAKYSNAAVEREKMEMFSDVYEKYSKAIYLHCFFRMYSKERAEELGQETFMKTWQYIIDGKEIKAIRPFLYRVALNLIIDEARKKKAVSLDALLANSKIQEPFYEEYGEIEKNVLFRDIMGKLKDFNEQERFLIVMRYVEDLEPRAIAEILGTSSPNVSVRLHRILSKLKKNM